MRARNAVAAGAMFFTFGLVTLLWLVPWHQLVRAMPEDASHRHEEPHVPAAVLLRQWPLWSMSIVHALGNYCFYFLLTWLPLFLTESRGFSKTEWVYIASIGYAAQGVCAFLYGHFTDWWTRSGRSEAVCRRWMMVASQSLVAVAIFGLAFPARTRLRGPGRDDSIEFRNSGIRKRHH